MNRTKQFIAFLLCTILITGLNINGYFHAANNFNITLTPNTNGYGSVSLDWSSYAYQDKNFKVYKSSDGGKTYETVGIDYTLVKEVKCLQIYPNLGNNLYTWMETNGYGKGIIKVDSISIDAYNSNPYGYLKDSNGNWKYDVLYFGAYDDNNMKDLSATSASATIAFIKAGRGCIIGHDTIMNGAVHKKPNFCQLAPYINISFNTSIDGGTNSTEYVKIVKKGLFTTYPWDIGDIGTILKIPAAHSKDHIANKNNIWLKFTDKNGNEVSAAGGENNNFYLTTYNNCAMIQTGHSNGAASVDEQKITANLIFYCNQLIFSKYSTKDSSAQDVAAPNKPTISVSGTNLIWTTTDNGSTYYYYVESYDKNDTTPTGLLDTSVTKNLTVTTGVKAYRYILDNNSSTVVTTTNGTSTTSNNIPIDRTYKYLHVAAIDGAGNISETATLKIPQIASYKVLHQQEQLNGTYTTVETENLSVTIGSSVTPAVKSYTGFTSPSTQTVTISADGSTTVTYKYVRKTYDLDVNVVLDGTSYNTGVDGITFDVYVNGTKVGSGKDFCKRSTYKYGSTYEIKNISCPGYTFDTSSSIKGTITASTEVKPKFTTNSYTVTYKDVVDSTSGTVLKETTASKKYGSSVRGTDIGSSTADNAYYNGYYYVSDTSATVGTSGATVYRIFKLRTINISGAVSWTDNSNKWSTRPNEVTVSLYRDGSKVDSTTGLTSSNSNNYSFNNVPKYSTSDGHVYNYTVSQSEAVSKTSPEDKYTTTQNTYNFTNVLGNTDKDADNKGLVVKGSIYWEDKGDALGYRPKTVTITLYQNGIEYKTLEVDSFNDNTYEFSKLPKYDKDLNKYEYTVKETMVANYLVTENGQPVLKDAYSIKADTPNALDFTNIFNVPDSTPIPVKPEHVNNVTVKTNTDDMITISLKGMETIINNDLSISYGNNYNGQVYNLSANNIGTVLSSMNSGKYEIDYFTTDYIHNDITCNGDNNIWIEGSGEKYYLVIKDTNVDVSGTITLNFSKKDHVGYQTDASVSNYFKIGIETTAIMSLEAEVFAISDMIIEAEDAYSVIYNNSDTIDENIYNAGDKAEIIDYEGKLSENKEFLGWSLLEDVEEPDYLVGDIISIKDMNISLYPVFKDIEEEISEMESTEETTESSESIEESSETEESTMEETSSEEETTESEESSTENSFSEEEAASTEEESSESTETIESSKLEK